MTFNIAKRGRFNDVVDRNGPGASFTGKRATRPETSKRTRNLHRGVCTEEHGKLLTKKGPDASLRVKRATSPTDRVGRTRRHVVDINGPDKSLPWKRANSREHGPVRPKTSEVVPEVRFPMLGKMSIVLSCVRHVITPDTTLTGKTGQAGTKTDSMGRKSLRVCWGSPA